MKTNQPLAVVVSPDLPPKRGGVADHTSRLLRELAVAMPTGVITSPGNTPPAGMSLVRNVSHWNDLNELWPTLASLPEQTVLVWQYVPHMYGRGGVNTALPEAISRWRGVDRRQMVIAHELFAPWSVIPNRWWYSQQQRRQWRIIRESVDAIGMSTETWLAREQLKAGTSAKERFFLCPSPSNIPVVRVAPDHKAAWRTAQGWQADTLVIAVFGSLGPASRWKWTRKAFSLLRASGVRVRVVTMGQGSSDAGAGRPEWLHSLGFVDASVVSEALQAADLLAVPYIDGISERRTSAMAGLAHGCCIASTEGQSTGRALSSGGFTALSPANDVEAYAKLMAGLLADEARRSRLGNEAAAAYRSLYDWPVVMERIRGKLAGLSGNDG